MKLLSLVLSLELGSTATTVTDTTGATITISDTLNDVYTVQEDGFNDFWHTTDDRIMGGQSYSYVNYENGYGVFNGTAVSEGGGFSNTGTTNYPDGGFKGEESMERQNWRKQDGLVIEVASLDTRTYKFNLNDNRWRFPPINWESEFTV